MLIFLQQYYRPLLISSQLITYPFQLLTNELSSSSHILLKFLIIQLYYFVVRISNILPNVLLNWYRLISTQSSYHLQKTLSCSLRIFLKISYISSYLNNTTQDFSEVIIFTILPWYSLSCPNKDYIFCFYSYYYYYKESSLALSILYLKALQPFYLYYNYKPQFIVFFT